jgi:aquaporin Z
MRQLAPYVVEAIGTFALIFVGAGSVVATVYAQAQVNIVAVALAHGLTIAVMGTALGHVSGGVFNPAISAALLVTRRLPVGKGLGYVAAQLLGGTLGALALRGVAPAGAVSATSLGATTLSPDTTALQGLGIEALLTGFLALAVFGTALDVKGPGGRFGAFAIGLTITLCVLVGLPFTGAAINPARSLGPAIAAGVWSDWWVYWIGPVAGAIAAAGLYEWVIGTRREQTKA